MGRKHQIVVNMLRTSCLTQSLFSQPRPLKLLAQAHPRNLCFRRLWSAWKATGLTEYSPAGRAPRLDAQLCGSASSQTTTRPNAGRTSSPIKTAKSNMRMRLGTGNHLFCPKLVARGISTSSRWSRSATPHPGRSARSDASSSWPRPT